jgi:hypothetical protein
VVPSKSGYAAYNFDFWEYPGPSAQAMFDTHQPVISSPYNLPNLSDPTSFEFINAYSEFYGEYAPPGRDPSEPLSEIYYVRNGFSLILASWPYAHPKRFPNVVHSPF